MPFFIEKMKSLIVNYPSAAINIQHPVFIFESLILTDQHRFQEALVHLQQFENEWNEKFINLAFISQVEIKQQQATVYYWNKDYKTALKIIRPILNVGKPFSQLPQIKSVRFLNILIHFDLGDFDYLDSEIRSFERELKKQNRLFKSEELILKSIKRYNNEPNEIKRKQDLQKQIEKLNQLKEDPFEKQLLSSFDFIHWLETKIQQ